MLALVLDLAHFSWGWSLDIFPFLGFPFLTLRFCETDDSYKTLTGLILCQLANFWPLLWCSKTSDIWSKLSSLLKIPDSRLLALQFIATFQTRFYVWSRYLSSYFFLKWNWIFLARIYSRRVRWSFDLTTLATLNSIRTF